MLHDYVFGIGLFLLIVAGILVGVLPTVLAPFEDTVGGTGLPRPTGSPNGSSRTRRSTVRPTCWT
jgi:hypothetical protein